ncbi:MAG TPA: hypothetical protein VJB88_03170 [Vicinamibacteria bacterium]|nr:hypothetical protein [Vicinamibacteria bacterium]
MFIAMAYYSGETLKRRLEQGVLPVDTALDIAIQVVWARDLIRNRFITNMEVAAMD